MTVKLERLELTHTVTLINWFIYVSIYYSVQSIDNNLVRAKMTLFSLCSLPDHHIHLIETRVLRGSVESFVIIDFAHHLFNL